MVPSRCERARDGGDGIVKSTAQEEPKTFSVKYVSPTAILPYFRNSKTHTKRQVLLLAKAIRTSGFDQPIVVDKDMVIIKGHGRRLAAIELKMDLVPVVVRDDLTPEECIASRIADNHVQSMSTVDKAIEKAEVLEFTNMGGVGADVFFDFMNAEGPKKLNPVANHGAKPKETKVAGKLETCPKCAHTFMEA